MTTLEDFTEYSAGDEVAGAGVVLECPLCGRMGVEERINGPWVSVLHVQLTEVLGDGMVTEPKDWCVVRSDETPQS
jgi:hypothetical protein